MYLPFLTRLSLESKFLVLVKWYVIYNYDGGSCFGFPFYLLRFELFWLVEFAFAFGFYIAARRNMHSRFKFAFVFCLNMQARARTAATVHEISDWCCFGRSQHAAARWYGTNLQACPPPDVLLPMGKRKAIWHNDQDLKANAGCAATSGPESLRPQNAPSPPGIRRI